MHYIYKECALFCIIFVSSSYIEKAWTRLELKAAQNRAFLDNSEYILPLRLESGISLPGLPDTIGYISTKNHTVTQIVKNVCEKVYAVKSTKKDECENLYFESEGIISKLSSDTFVNKNGHQFTIRTSLIEISKDVCNCAKEYGRLIPISQTEAKDHIKLPTLEIDSTVSGNNRCSTLMELIDNLKESSNIMITGEGGCGKTYALLHCSSQIVEKYTSEKSNLEIGPIPIYISLNSLFYNAVGIENYLIKKLAEKLHIDYKDMETQYIRLLEDIVLRGGYILWLCDGFNEVVSKEMQNKIVHEIKRLQHNKAYRFIITSRYNLCQTFSDICGSLDTCGFISYKMIPLLDEEVLNHVKKFLSENGKNENDIKIIQSQMMTNKNTVKSIYKKPMGLVMFCGIHTGKVFSEDSRDFFIQINTLGELIHNFIFYLRRAYEPNYTREFHSFLCYLGYRMNTDGVFSITESRLCDYCNDYVELSGCDGITVTTIKNNCYVNDIIKFEYDNGIPRINFNHQNYRDYFAASYLKEVIVSFDFSRINSEIGIDKKIPLEVLTILAEIICEYKCVEESSTSVIQKLLLNVDANILSPFAVALLVQIAVMGRGGDLTKFNFTNIDLSLTHLNKVNLSKKINGRPFCAQFDNCIITDETFMPVGHSGAPLAIINIKSRFIVTCSKGGICVFDMKR